jgi:signal peptidase II
MVVAILVAVIIIVYNYRLPTGHFLFRAALGLQLGGALGNLIDRIRLGHVTDFLDFGSWPVFNLADASIVGGVAVLVLLMLLEGRETAAQSQPEIPAERPSRPILERSVITEPQPTDEADSWPDNTDILRNE